MKQISDKSAQAIRRLSDKLSDLIQRRTTTMINTDSYRRCAKFWEWTQFLNT